ncbi:MAG: hypothetical protein RL557_113 [archaeon]
MEYALLFFLGFSFSFLFFTVSAFEFPFSSFNFSSLAAPSDSIHQDQIEIFDDRIVIHVRDASVSDYAPTGSMKPLLNEKSNGIRVKPLSEDDIQVGDIISFRSGGLLIVHRVVEKGLDSDGVYFITKGDNNALSDGKIRFSDIEYKTVGVIW